MNDLQESFGFTGKDIITGFVGVITGACSYLSGCSQFLLSPKVDEKGAHQDGQWFDTSRIEIQESVERVVLPEAKVKEAPGPDKSAPVR